MKLSFFLFFAGVAFCMQANASVSVNLTAGILSDSSMVPLQDTTLVQLVTRSQSTSSFSSPTATSFTGEGETIVSSFALNGTATTGVTGLLAQPISFSLTSSIVAGQSLLLRWYSTLTVTSTTPYEGGQYGEYTGAGWIVPFDGQDVALNFLTTSAGGSYADSVGMASLTVVPEPSTYALGGLFALGAAVAIRRKRRA